jgi:plastocyanin
MVARALSFVLAGIVMVAGSAGSAAGEQADGVITGTVRTKAARPRPMRITTDQRVCGRELPDDSIVVDDAGSLANAVVTLVGTKAPAGAAAEPTIVNSKCAFVPRVQIARPGASVKVRSEDAILHNTNLQTANGASIFNIGLPMPGPTVSRPLAAAGRVRIACNVHQWMRGWIVATDEIAAVTGADGTFRLTGVPPGTYELRVWHETLAEHTQKVTVAAGKPATVTVELSAAK